jgi:hypothetical protein
MENVERLLRGSDKREEDVAGEEGGNCIVLKAHSIESCQEAPLFFVCYYCEVEGHVVLSLLQEVGLPQLVLLHEALLQNLAATAALEKQALSSFSEGRKEASEKGQVPVIEGAQLMQLGRLLSSSVAEVRRCSDVMPANHHATNGPWAAVGGAGGLTTAAVTRRRRPPWKVGTTFFKTFPGDGTFEGVVVDFDAESSLHHVRYTDGDEEDLDTDELYTYVMAGTARSAAEVVSANASVNASANAKDSPPKRSLRKRPRPTSSMASSPKTRKKQQQQVPLGSPRSFSCDPTSNTVPAPWFTLALDPPKKASTSWSGSLGQIEDDSLKGEEEGGPFDSMKVGTLFGLRNMWARDTVAAGGGGNSTSTSRDFLRGCVDMNIRPLEESYFDLPDGPSLSDKPYESEGGGGAQEGQYPLAQSSTVQQRRKSRGRAAPEGARDHLPDTRKKLSTAEAAMQHAREQDEARKLRERATKSGNTGGMKRKSLGPASALGPSSMSRGQRFTRLQKQPPPEDAAAATAASTIPRGGMRSKSSSTSKVSKGVASKGVASKGRLNGRRNAGMERMSTTSRRKSAPPLQPPPMAGSSNRSGGGKKRDALKRERPPTSPSDILRCFNEKGQCAMDRLMGDAVDPFVSQDSEDRDSKLFFDFNQIREIADVASSLAAAKPSQGGVGGGNTAAAGGGGGPSFQELYTVCSKMPYEEAANKSVLGIDYCTNMERSKMELNLQYILHGNESGKDIEELKRSESSAGDGKTVPLPRVCVRHRKSVFRNTQLFRESSASISTPIFTPGHRKTAKRNSLISRNVDVTTSKPKKADAPTRRKSLPRPNFPSSVEATMAALPAHNVGLESSASSSSSPSSKRAAAQPYISPAALCSPDLSSVKSTPKVTAAKTTAALLPASFELPVKGTPSGSAQIKTATLLEHSVPLQCLSGTRPIGSEVRLQQKIPDELASPLESFFTSTRVVRESGAPPAHQPTAQMQPSVDRTTLVSSHSSSRQELVSAPSSAAPVDVAERNRSLIKRIVRASLSKQIEPDLEQFENLLQQIFEICEVRTRYQKNVFTPGQPWAKKSLKNIVNDQVTITVKQEVDISNRKMTFANSSDSSDDDDF